MFKTLIGRLPSNYRKDENSNLGKLYQVFAGELAELRDTINKVKEYQDLDNAKGRTLDRIGRNVMELRSTDDDEAYRQYIKTKITANLSKGDIETINEVSEVLVGEGFIGIQETWGQESYQYEPAGLVLKIRNQARILPFEAIDRTVAGGIDLKWMLELKQMKPEAFISTAVVGGESVTVYPYSITEVSSKGNVFIALGHNTATERINVYPREE